MKKILQQVKARQWLKRFKLKTHTASNIASKSDFLFEPPLALNHTHIELANRGTQRKIGAHTYFGSGVIRDFTSIGRFCSFGRNLSVAPISHPIDWLSTHPFSYNSTAKQHFGIKPLTYQDSKPGPTIGNDVWVGDNVAIMAGVTIGDGAIIATGSVVTKDIEPYAIVGGVPAKLIKYRFDQSIRDKLLELQWWNLDLKEAPDVDFSMVNDAISRLSQVRKQADYQVYRINKRKISPA